MINGKRTLRIGLCFGLLGLPLILGTCPLSSLSVNSTTDSANTENLEGTPESESVSTWNVIDTGQTVCYDDVNEIFFPEAGEPFFGQDAQHDGVQPAYVDNGDGTITDLNTGLTWQQTPDFASLRSWDEAQDYAASLQLTGYGDWRVPTIKELYSLIRFDGSNFDKVPYIDTDYFDFEYPDTSTGLRDMDAQYWSNTVYVGTTMNGNATAFGVNFADGRIKGYPKDIVGPAQTAG